MITVTYNIGDVNVHFGNSLKETQLSINCRCGDSHFFPLDASGHYKGPIPCDSCIINIQVDPGRWRSMVESFIENTPN